MPEEKQSVVIHDENVPKTGLGVLIYMGSRLKHDANQLVSSIKSVFHPVFTQDTDEETRVEDDGLSKESEDCKESNLLTPPSNDSFDDVFDAEYEEELKKAKMNVAQYKELLKPPEIVNTPITQKTHDANTSPPLDNLSERIGILLEPLNNKIWSLAQERGVSAAQKAGLLAKIKIQISTLQTAPINKDKLTQTITEIRKSIIDSRDGLSNYRSKWGSGFFFGTILRKNLAKRVTSKTLIDNLTNQLDDIEKGRTYSPNILLGIKN